MLGTFRAARHDPDGAARALQRAFELDPEGKAAAPHPAGPLRLLLVALVAPVGASGRGAARRSRRSRDPDRIPSPRGS